MTGSSAVGATLTCTAPQFTGRPDTLVYVFKTQYAEPERQRGPDNTYVIQERDRTGEIYCMVIATNAGGITRGISYPGVAIRE